MYPSTPIHPLLAEAGLIPASTLLDQRQKSYTYRLLTLPDEHPTKQILPISLRYEDGSCLPGELPDDSLVWTQNTWPALYGQWLAWQIIIEHSIDLAEGVELVARLTQIVSFEKRYS